MSTGTAVTVPAPRRLARNWKYVLFGIAMAGWAVSAVQAVRRGDPIPAPPIIVKTPDAGPAGDPESEPAGVKRVYGWTRPSPDDVPERVFAAPPGPLPPAVHLLAPAPVEVPADLPFDQGQLGSCGPNSAAALLLYTEARAGKKGQPPPSRLFVYYATRQVMGTASQDSGVSNSKMFRALATYGFCDEPEWPYQIQRFAQKPPAAAYQQATGRKLATAESVPQDLGAMRACLAAGKPFVFGFSVFRSFETHAVEVSGVVPVPTRAELTAGSIGGHDVLITGYDDRKKCFRFLNSYGRDWGDEGFGWMPYSYAANGQFAGDFWTIAESPR